jgi:beta-lactamase class D
MIIASAVRILAVLAACAGFAAPAAHAESRIERPDLEAVFAEHRAMGTFALLDASGERMTVVNGARVERRYFPASTFKIANSLIALETGAVRDEQEVIPYGGKPQPVKNWERDMGMREAIPISNVPVYQEIARRIGLERMKAAVDRLGYGNREVGVVVDRFWLDGPLQISAVEQARFVAGLARQQLPMSARSQAIVRDILRLEARDGAVLYGKTGWTTSVTPGIGWWVGWVERGGDVHAFALNIDMAVSQDAPKRLAIGRALLGRLGAL